MKALIGFAGQFLANAVVLMLTSTTTNASHRRIIISLSIEPRSSQEFRNSRYSPTIPRLRLPSRLKIQDFSDGAASFYRSERSHEPSGSRKSGGRPQAGLWTCLRH